MPSLKNSPHNCALDIASVSGTLRKYASPSDPWLLRALSLRHRRIWKTLVCGSPSDSSLRLKDILTV